MACAYCRYRKIKCDGAERCKNCVRTRRVCEYVPVPETAKNERADARSRAAVVAGVVVPATAHGKGAAGRKFSLSPKGKDQKVHGAGAPASSTSAKKQPRTAALTLAAMLPGPLTTTAIIPRGSVSSSSGALDNNDSDADAEGEVDTGDESDEAFVAATTSHSYLSSSAPSSSSSSRIVHQLPDAAPSYLANTPAYNRQSQPQSQSYLVRRPSIAQHRRPSIASSSASSGDSPLAPPTPLLISTTAAPTLHSHQPYNDYHNQHIHQHSHQQQPFQPANIQKYGNQEQQQRQQAASQPVPSAQVHHLHDQDDALGLKLSVTGWESVIDYSHPPPQQSQQQQSLLYQPWACPPSFDQSSFSQDSYFLTTPYQQQQQQQVAHPSRPALPTRSISISHPSQRHQPYPSPHSGAAGYQSHRASFSSGIHSTPAAPFDGRPGPGPAAHYHRASSSSYHGPSPIAAAACSSSVDPYGLYSASTAASYDNALGSVFSPPPSAPQQQQTASSSSSIPFNSSASADLSALFQGLVPDDEDDEDTDDAGADGGVGDLGSDWGEGMMLGVEMGEHGQAGSAAYSGGAGANLGLGLEFSGGGSDLPWAQGADVGLLY